jgi:hypothetical protein
MRSLTLPALAAGLVLASADRAPAQNEIRIANVAESSRVNSQVQQPFLHLTSIAVVTDDGSESDAELRGHAFGAYVPAEATAGITAGCAFSGAGPYGYNPDFGYGPGGMSVWPGVPACCDPWFGYCGEPRCFYECNCHQGTYQVFHCPKCNNGQCGPELLRWQKGDWRVGRQPAAMCYGARCCTSSMNCAKCQSARYAPQAMSTTGCDVSASGYDAPATTSPAVNPVPKSQPQSPRNMLPQLRSSRRTSIVRTL